MRLAYLLHGYYVGADPVIKNEEIKGVIIFIIDESKKSMQK
jgi:hypothetical protein